MLIEFSVGNFRSFRETQTLSMVAAGNISAPEGLEDNVFSTGVGDLRLLKSCAVYGPNASGKSNLIKAFEFMRYMVLKSSVSWETALGSIPTEPFRLREDSQSESSFFQVLFIAEGTQYRYGFEVTRERIISEWLFHVPSTKEAKLFERTSESGIVIKAGFKEGKGIESRTHESSLFLYTTAAFNGTISRRVMKWFREIAVASELPSREQSTEIFIMPGASNLDGIDPTEIVQFVKDLDLGVEDISVEEYTARYYDRIKKGDPEWNVKTTHRTFDIEGQPLSNTSFSMDHHESTGTQKLFALAAPILGALKYGRVLVIDELDARLHPLITTALIRLFHDKKKNPHNAQLIFATHDTNLLDRSLLRRDQIWFVEKDRQGASHLYSLVEFRVRKEAAFEKDYIQGRYGAIPFLGDFSYLAENTDNSEDLETTADAHAQV